MADEWEPVPEPMTWPLDPPIDHGGMIYSSITLRAPSVEETMKALAVRGVSNHEFISRLVCAVSGEHVPYEIVQKLPDWRLQQMAAYFEEFATSPGPDPLEQWRQRRREAAITTAAANSPAPGSERTGPLPTF